MRKTITLKIKQQQLKAYQNKYPLISPDAIEDDKNLTNEGDLIRLTDANGRFLGTGYHGKQNKGVGWILSWNENEKIDQQFFKQKISKAIANRKKYYADQTTTAFRVFNGEGDGIGGLTIDCFAGYYLINWYSKGVYSFHKEILAVFDELINYKAIYEKKRFASKGQYVADDDFVKGEQTDFPIIIQENGMNYAVDLNDGAMVGIFLDQRNVRKTIRDCYAKGKKVLNTFSYTGAFSVAAILGGAAHTTSVDLAKRSRPLTEEQFALNEIDSETQDIVVMDVFDYFKYAKRKNLLFDLVILDPPSFARSKKRNFSTAKDYPWLIEETIEITEKNGIIVASTNTATFRMARFKKLIEQGFKKTNGSYRILEEFSLPEDFRVSKSYKEGNYLKVLFIEKLS
ncbi:class I SAM-dependent rRNA methyltransferase [Ralstonia pickettii]|nr:class I SAM-dependent rRNA methyltransferase [Ralstonia pickettii]